VAFKVRQNPFPAGALPRTKLGELTTLLERGHLSPYPNPTRYRPAFGIRHASPQNSSQIYAYGSNRPQPIASRSTLDGTSSHLSQKVVHCSFLPVFTEKFLSVFWRKKLFHFRRFFISFFLHDAALATSYV